eukprot:1506996-Prymnesium_polylepis.1
MGALLLRARAASSPTRSWGLIRSDMTSSWAGCIISLVPGRWRWPFSRRTAGELCVCVSRA